MEIRRRCRLMTPTRRPSRSMLIVAGAAVAAVAALVGWFVWNGHQVWSRLESAADDFGVPDGFTELQRVRVARQSAL